MELSPVIAQQIRPVEVDDEQENIAPMAPLSPSKGGVAFDFDMKSPMKSPTKNTPGKARLEGYGDARSPPSTRKPLGSPDSGAKRLRSQELAERARERNEKARVVAERVRAQLDEIVETKRRGLEEDLEAKRERREAHIASVVERSAARGTSRLESTQQSKQQLDDAVAARQQLLGDRVEKASEKKLEVLQEVSAKAGKHFEGVKAKFEHVRTEAQKREQELSAKHQQDLANKGAAHDASVAQRGERASQHNDVVREKFEQHRAETQKREQELMTKVEQDLASKGAAHDASVAQRGERASQHNDSVAKKMEQHRADAQKREHEILAKHQQKTGSKIDGRSFEAATSPRKSAVKTQPKPPQSWLRQLADRLVCGRC